MFLLEWLGRGKEEAKRLESSMLPPRPLEADDASMFHRIITLPAISSLTAMDGSLKQMRYSMA